MSTIYMKKRTERIDGLRAVAASIVIVGALFGSGSALAGVFSFGSFLTNSNFEDGAAGTTIPGWTKVGTGAINVRVATDLINITTGNSGFATSNTGPGGTIAATGTGFFTSQFASLGDTTGTITGTAIGEPTAGTFRLYQDFALLATFNSQPVASYELTFDFKSVFEGRDSISNTSNDVFSATLINLDDPLNPIDIESLISKDSNGLRQTCLGNATVCADTVALHQIDTSDNTTVSGLLPGLYRLEFKLLEISTPTSGVGATANVTNTAVGIDNVVTSGSVTTIPEPATLGLIGLGLIGFAAFHKKKQA